MQKIAEFAVSGNEFELSQLLKINGVTIKKFKKCSYFRNKKKDPF